MDNIYVSLDEAREELKKRWNNAELQKIVEAEFGLKPLIVPLVPIEEEKCLFCWNSYFIK